MPARFQNLILRALAVLIQFHLWDFSEEKIASNTALQRAKRLKEELESSADLADL